MTCNKSQEQYDFSALPLSPAAVRSRVMQLSNKANVPIQGRTHKLNRFLKTHKQTKNPAPRVHEGNLANDIFSQSPMLTGHATALIRHLMWIRCHTYLSFGRLDTLLSRHGIQRVFSTGFKKKIRKFINAQFLLHSETS